MIKILADTSFISPAITKQSFINKIFILTMVLQNHPYNLGVLQHHQSSESCIGSNTTANRELFLGEDAEVAAGVDAIAG